MIECILPAGVESAEAYGDCADAPLLAAEEQIVARAVVSRRSEFATARACAREALSSLGLPALPIGRGRHGNPLWPAGIIGSITHCDGYRAAAVSWSRGVSIGIDAEPAKTLPHGLLRSIADPFEAHHVTELAVDDPGSPWDRLLFSAKESVYKAWFSATERTLPSKTIHVMIAPDRGLFTGTIESHGNPPTRFEGRWMIGSGLIVTAAISQHVSLCREAA